MKQTINKIVCPYDGIKNDERIFKKILRFAKKYEAKIIILTCIKDIATLGFFKLKSDKNIIENQKNNARKKLEELKNQAKNEQVKTESKIVICEDISKKIVNYTKKENADVIVMSKPNQSSITEKMYHEGIVEKVFKESPCTFIHVK